MFRPHYLKLTSKNVVSHPKKGFNVKEVLLKPEDDERYRIRIESRAPTNIPVKIFCTAENEAVLEKIHAELRRQKEANEEVGVRVRLQNVRFHMWQDGVVTGVIGYADGIQTINKKKKQSLNEGGTRLC